MNLFVFIKSKIKISTNPLLLALIFLFFSFTPSYDYMGNLPANDECNTINSTFRDGENLVYKLYYNWGFIWVPAGEVVFTVNELKNTYEIKAIGKTYKSYEHIFKVNDYYYTNIDKETMLPKNFVRIVEEGNYKLFDSIYFDQPKNIAVSYHGMTKSDAKPKLHHLNQCMQDMVSNIYHMRNLETGKMKIGDQIPVKMFFDREVFPLSVKYYGQEIKEIKELGKFNTLKLVPDVVEGKVFKKGDHMSVWVSNDQNKIPLLIESPVSVGSIKAVLKSYNKLKYPLSSQLNE